MLETDVDMDLGYSGMNGGNYGLSKGGRGNNGGGRGRGRYNGIKVVIIK